MKKIWYWIFPWAFAEKTNSCV